MPFARTGRRRGTRVDLPLERLERGRRHVEFARCLQPRRGFVTQSVQRVILSTSGGATMALRE
jgi:hypothetical protein